MKRVLLYFSIFLSVQSFLLASCSKKNENPELKNTVRGQIINTFTKQPVEKASIFLYYYDYSQSTHAPLKVFYADTLTNAAGYFSIGGLKPGSYLQVEKKGYWEPYIFHADDFAGSQQKTVEFQPKMYVNVRVIKTDTFWNSVQLYALNTQTWSNYTVYFDPYVQIDSICSGLLIYEDYYTLKYRLAKTTQDTFITRSTPINLKSLDTVSVTIQF